MHVLDLRPETSARNLVRVARDLREAARLWRLCCTLGWLDVKLRYRGSVLGPFWLTASTAVMVAAMSLLYTTLFHIDVSDYMPFLSLSLVLWGFISSIFNEGTTCFTSAESMIKSLRLPFGVHVARTIVRNILVLLHNIVVVFVVFAIFHIHPGLHGIVAIPGLMLWLLDAAAVCLLFGSIGARYRDIPPVVASAIQIFFFVSPIIWKPDLVAQGHLWLRFNPFFPLLEIVRRPLLGQHGTLASWPGALAASALLWVAAMLVFARARARIAYWL
ncbi:MAG: ABC transporter permease [Gluconacetobacter diazotrophicus]|nr:ABC transporter permease [Gluconacetobacter diazotrophicus]